MSSQCLELKSLWNMHLEWQRVYTQATSKCSFQDAWAIHDQGVYFIKGYSLNERHNDEHDLLWRPTMAGLETL